MFSSYDSPCRIPLVFIVALALLVMLLFNFVLVSGASQTVRVKKTQAHFIKETFKGKKSLLGQQPPSGEKGYMIARGNDTVI
jgi:hypothetical protein